MERLDVEVERDIAAPAATLWTMVSDVTRMADWSPESEGGEWLAGATGPAVGASFRGRNRNGAKRWSTTNVVVACQPGTDFAFETRKGPLRIARWAYRFEPTGRSCRVVETWTDQRGRLAAALGKPVSGVGDRATHNRVTMEATLERLAAAAESPAAAGPPAG